MAESVYVKLAERLDMNISGAPKIDGGFSPAFLEYLEILFTPEEAEVASLLSVEPNLLTAEGVAKKADRPVEEIERVLSGLLEKRVIIGTAGHYMLPIMPYLFNLFPHMDRDDEASRKAAELYQEYFIKDRFYRFYSKSAAGTRFRRAVPVNESISAGQQVLSHEEIDMFLDQANLGAYTLAPCPCRNRTDKMGARECKDKFPIGSCLFLGMPAMMMAEVLDTAKQVSREEAKTYLEEMREAGLVMMTDNTREMKDGVICLCCGCCCSVTRGLTKWNDPEARFARSDFVARASDECVACGECVDRCMFDAISLDDGDEKVRIDEDKCMGCGVCTVTCPTEALRLDRLEREPIYSTLGEMLSKAAAENEAVGQKRPLD
jgi:electron transport complex protein RnfB